MTLSFPARFCSEQQPLRLNPAEVGEVIAAVCSEASSIPSNPMTVSPQLNSKTGKPSMDVAVSVLIKLVIDMYGLLHCSQPHCVVSLRFLVILPSLLLLLRSLWYSVLQSLSFLGMSWTLELLLLLHCPCLRCDF